MKKVMAKSGVKKAQNGMSAKTAKAKPMAKKAPAKMVMKKPAVKKAQEGLKTDRPSLDVIKKSLQKNQSDSFYNVSKKIDETNQIRKKAQEEKNDKAFKKSLKDQGFDPSKLKNGGKIKK